MHNNNITVVGAGISGLLSTYYHLKCGFEVTLIDCRGLNFTRANRVVLTNKFLQTIFADLSAYPDNGYSIRINYARLLKRNITMDYDPNKKLPDACDISRTDRQFYSEVRLYVGVMPVSVVQMYIYRKILSLYGDKFVFIKGEVTGSDDEEQKLLVDTGDHRLTLSYQRLILAEGARGNLTSLFSPDLRKRNLPIPIDSRTRHCAAFVDIGAVSVDFLKYLNEYRFITSADFNSTAARKDHLPLFAKFGWKQKRLPLAYIHYSQVDGNIYFVGEVPDTNQLAVSEWVQLRLRIEYPCLHNMSIALDHKKRARISVFDVHPQYLKLPSCLTTSVYVIGDALLQANYLFGHGFEFAMRSAKAVSTKIVGERYTMIQRELVRDYNRKNREYKVMLYLLRNPRQKKIVVDMLDKAAKIFPQLSCK